MFTLVAVLIVFALEVKRYTHLAQYINRLISLVAIASVAIRAIKYSKLQCEPIKIGEQGSKSLGDMLPMNSHKIRIPVTNIMGLCSDRRDY